MRSLVRVSVALGALAVGALPAAATTWRVPRDLPTVQQALDRAVDGDVILVSPGVYRENIDFLGKAVWLQGLAGGATAVLDGGGAGPVVRLASGEPRAAVLRGFTIRNGHGTGGGGVEVSGSPTITGNVIRDNRACTGAGIQVENGFPLIAGNAILDNTNFCTGPGAGGAAIHVFGAQLEARENVIRGNRTGASSLGAALHLNIAFASLVAKNWIVDNVADGGDGGAVALLNGSSVVFEQNVFAGNRARRGGAVMIHAGPVVASFVNNTLVDNVATLAGSALFVEGRVSHDMFLNNIVVGTPPHEAIACGSQLVTPPAMTHDVVFTPGALPIAAGCPSFPTLGSFFVDPALRPDLTPAAGSIAVDAAAPTALVGSTDISGRPRRTDGDHDGSAVLDIGALERPGPRR
jgi:hypothetical protein